MYTSYHVCHIDIGKDVYGLHLMKILMYYYPLIRFYHSSTLLYPIHPPTNHVTWDCEEIV